MSLKIVPSYTDIKVPEGKIAVIPWDNRLFEMPPYVNETAPVPQWVREAQNGPGSIRRCAATMDYVTSGITIPAWTNFRFTKSKTSHDDWEFSADQYEGYLKNEVEPFTSQPFQYEQTGECPITRIREVKEIGYPKLVTPYRFVTAPGWSMLILPVLYEPSPHFSVLPGIVHTDFYHEANCVLNLIGSESFVIPWGAPLMHLIPIQRTKMSHELEFYDERMYKLVVGRGFGSGALKPSFKDWSSARLYRATRMRKDAELRDMPNASNNPPKWWRRKP